MDQTGTAAAGPGAPGPEPQPTISGPGQPPGSGAAGRGRRHYRYRSLFWPVILIGAGVMWLLYSLDVISASNLEVLGLVWPVFVIAIGVDLLVGHRSAVAGAIVGVVTVGIVIALTLIGPGAGWVTTGDLKTETFSTPVGEATEAQVEIGLSGYTTSLHALPAAVGTDRPLLYASVTHRGTIEFSAEGTTQKVVTLKSGNRWQWWQWIGSNSATPWDIGLDRGVPLSVIVRASSGSSTLDLTGLQVRKLELQASSGDSQVVLPGADPLSAYRPDIRLNSSSGRMDVQAPDAAAFGMKVDMSSGDTRVTLGTDSAADVDFRGSSGQFVLTVRPGQALRVEVKSISSGDVKLPDGLTRISGEGNKGAWQTPGYDSATNRVSLVVESMSSGTVKVQMVESGSA
jgi:hypothetical protein